MHAPALARSWRTPQPRPHHTCSRWDAWARLTEKITSKVPFLTCTGNHEIEPQYTTSAATDLYVYKTFTAANARYPMPQVHA